MRNNSATLPQTSSVANFIRAHEDVITAYFC